MKQRIYTALILIYICNLCIHMYKNIIYAYYSYAYVCIYVHLYARLYINNTFYPFTILFIVSIKRIIIVGK